MPLSPIDWQTKGGFHKVRSSETIQNGCYLLKYDR